MTLPGGDPLVLEHAPGSSRHALLRKTGIALAGAIVFALGAGMIFLPAPGALVMALGFAIWAREFRWARRSLRWLRASGRALLASCRARFPRHLSSPFHRAASQSC